MIQTRFGEISVKSDEKNVIKVSVEKKEIYEDGKLIETKD